jgi:hypothetical protein
MKIFKTKKYSILSNILKFSFVFIFGILLIGGSVLAAPDVTNGNGTSVSVKIENPLGPDGAQDIPGFIKEILKVVMIIGVPIVTLAIIYTGFLFVKAQGNPEQITKAKGALTYTLIGSALLLGAFVISSAIKTTVDEIIK